MTKAFNIISLVVFISAFSACKNLEEQENVSLVYEDGIEKITIEIKSGKDYLVYDTPTRTDFIVNNIDPITLTIYGAGIRILGTNKDKTAMRTEINVPSNYLDKDTLTIKVRFGEDHKKGHDFNIPLKKSE